MTGVTMTVPRNVLWFEVLLYLSLMLDALSVAFQDRTPTAQLTESTIMMASLMAACLIFPLTAVTHDVPTMILLVVAAGVHVTAELWYSAGGWGISFGLAPDHAHGQYQGTYAMGHQFGQMIAPVLVTALILGWGTPGWLLLGAAFAVVGCLIPPVVRRAVAHRAPACSPSTVDAGT